MNRIEQMIAKFCPNGVEFKSLLELGYFYGGLTGKSKHDFSGGNAKFITYMNVFSNISVNTEVYDYVKVNAGENQNKVEIGDVLFTGSSETAEECGMSSVMTRQINEPIYLNSFCFGFRLNDRDSFLPDFFKYLFRGDELRKQIIQTASGVTRYNVSKKRMGKILIPVPPLEIQQEIVNILDKFTALEAELEAELEARRKQYEHYRSKLLTFNDINGGRGHKWLMISDLCTKTESVKWRDMAGREFQYIDLSSVSRENNHIIETQTINAENAPSRAQQVVRTDDVIFGTTRPTLKRLCSITPEYDEQICSTGFCVLRANRDMVLPRYLYFALTTNDFYNYVEGNQEGAGYPSIANSKVMKYPIVLPPIEEQNRIVAILDKFEKLVNDISEGLPAEIKARRQQYEYYRNKLLTFKQVA
jgi:type I restriction enzyme S subunit